MWLLIARKEKKKLDWNFGGGMDKNISSLSYTVRIDNGPPANKHYEYNDI